MPEAAVGHLLSAMRIKTAKEFFPRGKASLAVFALDSKAALLFQSKFRITAQSEE
jgi:hypothetical protein